MKCEDVFDGKRNDACSVKGTPMRQQRFWIRGGGNGLAALAALFTTLCCLGFPALIGFIAVLGAGFLVSDRYLEPLLAVTLLLTLLMAGLRPPSGVRTWPMERFLSCSLRRFGIFGSSADVRGGQYLPS